MSRLYLSIFSYFQAGMAAVMRGGCMLCSTCEEYVSVQGRIMCDTCHHSHIAHPAIINQPQEIAEVKGSGTQT